MRLWLLISLIALIIGVAFLTGHEGLQVPMLLIGVVALAGAGIAAIVATKDYANPLAVLLFSALLRLGLPGVASLIAEPPTDLIWFALPSSYWALGRGLAMVGLLAVAIGWLLIPARIERRIQPVAQMLERRFVLDRRMVAVALLSMLLGAGFILLFMRLNFASPIDAIAGGIIRGTDHRVADTSRYNFLSYWLLVTGVVTLSVYLLYVRGVRWWQGLLPALGVALIFSPFGQRVSAVTALVYALIVLWYRGDYTRVRLRSVALVLALLVPLGLLYAGFVGAYRGAGLASGARVLSWAGFVGYLEYTTWLELGTLHPFVMATVFDPGVLAGQTYPLMGGYASDLLGLSGIRPGAFLVEQLIDSRGGWGFHTGLIVDLYMNSGVAAVVAGGVLFGATLRLLYALLRAGQRSPVIMLLYTILIWNLLWVFYESIINLFPLMMALACVVALFGLAALVPTAQQRLNPRALGSRL